MPSEYNLHLIHISIDESVNQVILFKIFHSPEIHASIISFFFNKKKLSTKFTWYLIRYPRN